MRYLVAFVIFSIFITGCSKSGDYIDNHQYKVELEELQRTFNKSIESLKLSHQEELQEKDDEIGRLKSEVEELKHNQDKFGHDYTEVQGSGKTFRLYTAGTEYLENGIVCILEAFDNNKELLWIQSWGGLQVSELATFSPITILGDMGYIVISGELNAFNVNTGKILWRVADLGCSFEAPLVDDDGVVYVVGQYQPYLSAVNDEGMILWKVDSNELSGASGVYLKEDYLVVKCYKGDIKYYKNGTMFE